MFEPFKNVSVTKLDKFVGRTTVTDQRDENIQFIHYFIQKNACNIEVCKFLSKFLLNEEIIGKTVIVNDATYYQTAIKVTSTIVDDQMLLDKYEQHAECIFLHLQFDDENEHTEYAKETLLHRRKKYWKFYYQQEKKKIFDCILDEYNMYRGLFARTNNEEYIHKANNWIRMLRSI